MDLTKLRAEPIPFSSIVGQSITLYNADGQRLCQLNITAMAHDLDRDAYKALATRIGAMLCEKINN